MKNKKYSSSCMSGFRLLFFMILFSMLAIVAYAQSQTVSGVINDMNGEPVIGASVLEKGTSNGTITDLDGKYSLNVRKNAILVISYIGYKTQELKPVHGKALNITLIEDAKALEEVVVIGFGTQKKVNLTGAVGIASSKDLESRPVTTATQALQGLVPGLQITTDNGELGKSMSINIRGKGTIGAGSSGSPLILIDGMEGDLETINPQDIENISVLKDAAASSIYGSRAPFGVILVTTKSGSAGKVVINYNNNFRISSPINLPEMMDSYTFANYFNEAQRNQNGGFMFNDEVMQKMLDFQSGKLTESLDRPTTDNQWGKPSYDPYTAAYANTDWYEEIYKDNVFSQEHNVSFTGGTQKHSFYSSFNYMNQSGLIRHGEEGRKRYTGTLKVNSTLTPWLKFNASMRLIRIDGIRPTFTGATFYNLFGPNTWPNLPVYDPNGYYFNNNAQNLAMRMALEGDNTSRADQHHYQGALLIEPIKNWITHVEVNYRMQNSKVKSSVLPVYNHDVDGNIIDTKATTSLYQETGEQNYLNMNIYSEYSHVFNDVHHFKIMAGFQAEEQNINFMSVRKYGLTDTDKPELNLTTGLNGAGKAQAPVISGYQTDWATAGFFGRLNYDYKGTYLVEVNMRYDGTSRFRRGNRWQISPSFSLGWNIANEKFWKSISHISNLMKLRASYGVLGNQNTTLPYPTYRTMSLGAYNGSWLDSGTKPNTAAVGALVSTALTWEKVRSWNVGLDFGFFNNRLNGSFDYYTRFTDNMVGPATELPAVLGLAVPATNNCDLRTKGWELSLTWRDRLKNNLGYSVSLTLSDAKTIVDSYPSNITQSLAPDTYVEGREIGEIWGFETIGIAKTDEEMQAHLERVGGQSFGSKWTAGDIMYADLDGKPGITTGANTLEDHGDKRVIGNNTPHYFFGIHLNADWKGFDIGVFFQGVMKRDYWQGDGYFWGVDGSKSKWNARGFAAHNDYFRAESIGLDGRKIEANVNSYYPRPIFKEGAKNQQVQTRYLQDASYIRLKNLQVGYTLPAVWMNKIGFSKCRIFVSGENLWTGTSLSDLFDPETISGGTGGNAYPLSKTISFGLSLTL